MKAKIVKCSFANAWYKEMTKLGCIFPVVSQSEYQTILLVGEKELMVASRDVEVIDENRC